MTLASSIKSSSCCMIVCFITLCSLHVFSLPSQTKKRSPMNHIIRPIHQNETMLLVDFLYEAIYQPDRKRLLPRTVIQHPDLWIYIDGFGSQKGDLCLVAEVDKTIVGAVWARLIHACGFVDEHTPELAISVYPVYQGKGIGTHLMQEMLQCLRAKGFGQVTLSVSKDNYAPTFGLQHPA